MNNLAVRTLLFFVAIPLLGAIVIFIPYHNYIGINVIAILASLVGGIELCQILKQKGVNFLSPLGYIAGIFLPTAAYLETLNIIPADISIILVPILIILIWLPEIFIRSEKDFSGILLTFSSAALLIIYPGLFLSYLPRITAFPSGAVLVSVFVLAIYLNDTAAYVFGKLFGRYSRKLLVISPKKSLVGFIGGFLLSPIVIIIAQNLFPELFPGTVFKAILFGSAIGLTTILGDLFESAMKRSATVKDSGAIIPGRGGLLDSIDSPVISAPVYFILYKLLFL